VCSALNVLTYQTNRGSKNWMTTTKPRVTRIRPKLTSNIRQQIPFVLGQNGLGAAMVSTTRPPLREVFVFTVETSEGA
jgi:hypothetical protein